MAFDREALSQALAEHGPVVRVVVCSVQGSTPREAGAAMLVWAGGQSGTIGGGALEFQAAAHARTLLAEGGSRIEKVALGPGVGQCCGGALVLGYERFDSLDAVPPSGLFTRKLSDRAPDTPPLPIAAALKAARNQGVVAHRYSDGWLAEPIAAPTRNLWIWGAGHVGRALVAVLAPLPGLAITWVDTDATRFPDAPTPGVTRRIAQNPADLVPEAPASAEHLILTYSHALDLDLCHRLLGHGFRACGLIGSATKWARFRHRLQALGHDPAQILRITCPIGDPSFGKHPQAIAISVASALLSQPQAQTREIAL
jgi:xanthine dehydrogenase accessory factor